MVKARHPITSAVRELRRAGVVFEPLLYRYEARGGTARSAAELGWDEHAIVKTLVLQRDDTQGLLLLMHGDREASLRGLARAIGARSVETCTPERAQRLTGYQVGGISPFGLRTPLPIYAEMSVLELDRLAINGGKRGFLVAITGAALRETLAPTPVEVATW